ncbi:MAG: hypothetical protein C0596_06640 [Marinilabiliales bacterium]|nr:MAG: hypothetical protein C0596_06640 [Marinilabiliales bacterium]
MDKLTKIVFLLMALGCVLIFLLYFLFQKFEIGTAEKTDIVLNPNQKILAQIDNINISFQDVQYKINIEKVYGNVEVDAPLAFIMLVNDTFEELIAQKYGILPTNAEVISFINHYDSTTIAPEILKKIKSIFGADTASFYRLFITPKIINQKLRNYYWYTP